MVDTIRIICDLSMVNFDMDFMAEVSAKINVDFNNSNEFKILGHLKNMRITIKPSFVMIEGSLPKYYNGTNLITLTTPEVKQAIDKLSVDLGLPLHDAIVTRVDLAVNLEMLYPPKSYFIYFDELNLFERVIRGYTSLYYEQPKRCVLIIYDKIVEAKKHKDPTLTPELLEKNILRYEIRCWRQKLKELFKRKIKAKDLYNIDILCRLMEELVSKHVKIVKKSLLRSKIEMTKQGLYEHLLRVTNKKINVIKLIESHGVKGSRKTNDLKRNVIKILNTKVKEDNLIEELEDKLGDFIVEYYITEESRINEYAVEA